ncbi:MAG: acyltransferase family protein, partial [Candidatus Krumholzibacteriaceae bacterium]
MAHSEVENALEKSGSERATAGRIEVIDFLRGFAIMEMIVGHIANYPPILVKLIDYAETGMGLFLLSAGFMIGWHYLPRYLRDQRSTTRRLWKRALKILVMQYLIIATVNVPLHLIGFGSVGRGEPLWLFVFKSATFMNQIGIVHVLPTFIPMFLVSPFILLLFKERLDWLVFVSSAALFTVGNFWPHLLDLGDPAIFPFLVIQIWFVAGCAWGKVAYTSGRLAPRGLNWWLIASCAGLIITITLVHGKIFPGRLVSTHPLNIFGLLYQLPILTMILFGAMRFWRVIRAIPFFYSWIALLGRNALLAFVLHIYCAKAIGVLNS